MKILSIVLPIILIVAMALLYKKSISGEAINIKSHFVSIIGMIIGALVLLIVPFSIHQVDAGTVAVVKIWGEAKEVRNAGLYFDFWLSRSYNYYDTKTQQITIRSECYSNDGQAMEIEMVVQYQIQPNNAIMIANNYGGLDMLENRINTISLEKAKSVLSQDKALDIIKTRSEVSPKVEASIKDAITTDYFVNINTVVLTDIVFTPEFEKTIEDKMIAEQQKLKAEIEKDKAIIQAQQDLEVAKLTAEAKLEQSRGEAEAIKEIARAEADAIKLKSIEVARMLGFNVTETIDGENIIYDIDFTGKSQEEINTISEYLKYVEYLDKWDGELPTVVGDSATIVLPNP